MDLLKRKERLRIIGIAATTDPVKKGGRTYKITEEELKKAAKTVVGKPLLHAHRGKPIGKVEKAWCKDGKLYIESVIYQPRNDMEEKIIEKIEKGELKGLSPAFRFKPLPTRGVLHGSMEVIEETEDGALIVEIRIPKEEIIRKLGSIENIQDYGFSKYWIHDGTPESKKRIECEVLKENDSSSH